MRTPPPFLAAALILALAALPGLLRAEPGADRAAAPAPDTRSDAEVDARLAFIEDALAAGNTYANVWYWGWTAGQLGAAGLFAGLAYAKRDDPASKANNAVSAVQSFAGGAVLVFFPLEAAFATTRLERYPATTAAQRRAKLTVAERLLTLSAEGEQLGRHWINHALGIAVAAAGGLLLTFAYAGTDWRDGLINFAIGVAITEASIWTQPMRAVRDADRYERFGADQPVAARRPRPELRVAAAGPGLGLVLAF